VPVFRLVAGYEILQIVIGHLVFLFRKMDIGPEVIKPDLFCPRVFAGGFVFEKNHVCLDPLGIKYAGGQPQDGVQIKKPWGGLSPPTLCRLLPALSI